MTGKKIIKKLKKTEEKKREREISLKRKRE